MGEKLVAEYDDRNHNLRIYVYKGDVVVESFYDDNDDDKIEIYFSNGVRYEKEASLRNSDGFFEVILNKLLGTKTNSRKSVKAFFEDKDYYFRKFKRELKVNSLLEEQRVSSHSRALDELLH